MQVLEKTLQEIEERINDMAPEARECEEMEEYVEAEAIDHTISGLNIASNIIRSHMEDDGWILVEERLPEKSRPYWVSFSTPFGGYVRKVFWEISRVGFVWPNNGRKVKDKPYAWKPYHVPEPYQPKEGKNP